MKKINYFYLSLLISISADAGLNGLTIHSRANCVNNESISWDATGYHMLATQSVHYSNPQNIHVAKTGWENTWRSAAVHWAEASPGSGWTVTGLHWVVDNNLPRLLGEETATDCNKYDGWWEHDKPQRIENNDSQKIPFNSLKGPLPGDGVKTLPLSEVNIPDELKKQILKNLTQQKSNGYYFQKSDYPKKLLAKNLTQDDEISDSRDPYDTHLKKNLSLIKLAFPYKGIKGISERDFIGYAVIGMWKDGWTGIKEFFKNKDLGLCTYSLNNMAISDGAVQVPLEIASDDINKKVTIIDVKGSKEFGFTYTISWFDNTYSYDLQCVNMNFNLSATKKMIEFAKNIDANR